jgi:uncharacterized protein YegL
MPEFEQIPFAAAEFADNPEPRCPCLLLLDTSHSMQGQPISELNRGLGALMEELTMDTLAMKRVELAIVTFGPVKVLAEFQNPDMFSAPHLATTGNTPLGAAIEQGLAMLRERKDVYRENGIAYYRPWIFMITDGAPTDDWRPAANAVKDGEASGAFSFFAVGVDGADFGILAQTSTRTPMKLNGLKFQELFLWLSSSLSGVSQSQTGQRVALPSPAGWTSV